MADFKFDENAFKRVAKQAVQAKARETQRLFDRLGRELKGSTLDTAKRRLKREWERDGGTLTEPELTSFAQHLVDGTRIKLTTNPIRWQ